MRYIADMGAYFGADQSQFAEWSFKYLRKVSLEDTTLSHIWRGYRDRRDISSLPIGMEVS